MKISNRAEGRKRRRKDHHHPRTPYLVPDREFGPPDQILSNSAKYIPQITKNKSFRFSSGNYCSRSGIGDSPVATRERGSPSIPSRPPLIYSVERLRSSGDPGLSSAASDGPGIVVEARR